MTGGTQTVDVRNYFDANPGWASTMPSPPTTTDMFGRMTGSSDRGQRTMTAYDVRGRPIWTARQMALIPSVGALNGTVLTNPLPIVDSNDAPTAMGTRSFDEDHDYVMTNEYDRADRPFEKGWPVDPDYAGTGTGTPTVAGRIFYNSRNLPRVTQLVINNDGGEVVLPIHRSIAYNEYRENTRIDVGATEIVARHLVYFDVRRRPYYMRWNRPVDVRSGMPPNDLNAVAQVVNNRLFWDAANNLRELRDDSVETDWPSDQKPRRQLIHHDALYRVHGIDYEYRVSGAWTPTSAYTDWRIDQANHTASDPMGRVPAGMVPTVATNRVQQHLYRYDWLANMVEWTDDGSNSFYERALGPEGQIQNGFDAGPSGGQLRPTALYLSSDIRSASGPIDVNQNRGGWVHLQYGESGNVEVMTVRGECYDTGSACWDDTSLDESARATHLVNNCDCKQEQHYQYRWDELNRIVEARRYEWGYTRSRWELLVRQRYRYDGANQRLIKETHDQMSIGTTVPPNDGTDGVVRAALYVYPGDYERRGVQCNLGNSKWEATGANGTESQYMVAGARVVWENQDHSGMNYQPFEPEVRVTYALPNLIQSTTGVVDLLSGELLERTTFYPNGARETLRTNTASAGAWGTEPLGFTGKEGDDEVGLTYFGERYLLQHLGRWASPDPLQVHQGGGGEFANSYHYVGGNLLQVRDPIGLDGDVDFVKQENGDYRATVHLNLVISDEDEAWVAEAQEYLEAQADRLRSISFEREFNGIKFHIGVVVNIRVDSGSAPAPVPVPHILANLSNDVERLLGAEPVRDAIEYLSQLDSLATQWNSNVVVRGDRNRRSNTTGALGEGGIQSTNIMVLGNMGPNSGKHELAHLLGLQERYRERTIRDPISGERRMATPPDPGYEGNMMAYGDGLRENQLDFIARAVWAAFNSVTDARGNATPVTLRESTDPGDADISPPVTYREILRGDRLRSSGLGGSVQQ